MVQIQSPRVTYRLRLRKCRITFVRLLPERHNSPFGPFYAIDASESGMQKQPVSLYSLTHYASGNLSNALVIQTR